MKNPESKMLRIHTGQTPPHAMTYDSYGRQYGMMLAQLAVAESNLVRAGKDSAMPHFIAIVKELERIYGFEFKIANE